MVSTANSGGFASIRTRSITPPLDLRGIEPSDTNQANDPGANTGIKLRLTGDGNRYKFILRDRDSWDGIAHCYSFETQRDTPMTVRIPFADCVPTFRAKSVPDCPRLDGQTIAAFQFMLSKFEYDQRLNPSFQPGAFRLLIESIAAYRAVPVAPILMVGESAAIAIARTALGDRATDLGLDQLDLNTAIVTIPRNEHHPTDTLDAIVRHLKQS
ncbi:MAG: CIA30 family protein [Coleofasciculaceae cyanobacterium RL_1_1]|nr:CIA30 family protein [Coleofasciculaceae cyanobacterium RL_1_1]